MKQPNKRSIIMIGGENCISTKIITESLRNAINSISNFHDDKDNKEINKPTNGRSEKSHKIILSMNKIKKFNY